MGQGEATGWVSPNRGRKTGGAEKLPGIPADFREHPYFLTSRSSTIKLFDELSSGSRLTSRVADTYVPAGTGNLVSDSMYAADLFLEQLGYGVIGAAYDSFIR